VLCRVWKDHPTLALLGGVVPDLERTRGLGEGEGGDGATVYIESMS